MKNSNSTVLDQAFPIISRLISDLYAEHQRWISRDELAAALRSDNEGRKLIRSRSRATGNSAAERAANWVDWFSAHLTSKKPIVRRWQKAFDRKHLGVWHYRPRNNDSGTEIVPPRRYPEGAVVRILVDRFERSGDARTQCILHFGAICQICGFDFEEVYGKAAQGYTHVHHLRSLAEVRRTYRVDPIKDLLPVCANCHGMIHRRNPAYTPEEVKQMLRKSRKLPVNQR